MKDKKILILIGASVLALVSLVYGLTADPVMKKTRTRAPAPLSSVTRPAITHSSEPLAQARVLSESARPRTEFEEWGKNPFDPLSTEPILAAIAWNQHEPRAFIDSKVIYEGDVVQGKVVSTIAVDHVILKDDKTTLRLEL